MFSFQLITKIKPEKHQSDSNKNLEGNESLPSKNDHVRVAEPTTKDNSNQNLSNTDDIKNTLSKSAKSNYVQFLFSFKRN